MAQVFSSAPLLSSLRVKGGTFYTLSSTNRQLSMLVSNGNVRIVPSKFACLRLPNWEDITQQSMFYDGAKLLPTVTDPNTVFPKAVIQNYVENLIQYSESARVDTSLNNFAEAAFFKALRSEIFSGTDTSESSRAMQVEEDEVVFDTIAESNVQTYKEISSVDYQQVIKYVGDVNLLNHVKSGANEYVEVYAHIPTDAGLMTDIRLYPNTIVQHDAAQIPGQGGDGDATSGLSSFKGTGQVEPNFDTLDFKYDVNSDIDKLGIDFDDLESSVDKHNKGDFSFNCILLYYDIYEADDDTTRQRNLYGILLLDKFESSGGSYSIKPLVKYMPDENQPGNSFGFRFNLKFSNYSNQVTSEITVNEYSTLSMELYVDALKRLQKITDEYGKISKFVIEQQQTLAELRQGILADYQNISEAASKITDMDRRISSLEASSSNSKDVRITNEDLFRLFSATAESMQNTADYQIHNTIVMTHKALLPKIIDKSLLIAEDSEGNRFRWDSTTEEWIAI